MLIDELRALCNDETIVMTEHAVLRCRDRGIKYDAVKQAIMSGEIIEDYPEDYPYPSCLVLSMEVCLHVVAGIGDGILWIITAYRPGTDKWEKDLKTRKAARK